MRGRPRRKHSPAFKSNVAFLTIKGEQTVEKLANFFDAHTNKITQWKILLLERATAISEEGESPQAPIGVKSLHAKISKLSLENDSLETALTKVNC